MTSAAEYQAKVTEAAAAACNIIKQSAYLMPYDAMLSDVVAQMQAGDADGRTVSWRVRLRLYAEADAFSTPVADSDPGLPPDMEGATHIGGLPAVAAWARELVLSHHGGAACMGLTDTALGRKVKGLRTQMSGRGDGTGVMRLPYAVAQGEATTRMIARVDVVRGSAVATRAAFSR